jgi:hypothetical protein
VNGPATTVVGVVSDTHLPRFGRVLPRALRLGLREAEVGLILHAGDLTDALALELLGGIAPVVAIAGNNDPPDLHEALGERALLDVAGVRIGLVHGHAGPGRTTRDRAVAAFPNDPPDVIVFGHSHIPLVERSEGTWLVNPGSPTDRRRQPAFSYALLRIDGGRAAPELVRYTDRTP